MSAYLILAVFSAYLINVHLSYLFRRHLGIELCKQECFRTGFCSFVKYDTTSLRCTLEMEPVNGAIKVKRLHKQLCTNNKIRLQTKRKSAHCVKVYCVKYGDAFSVGDTWGKEDKWYTCTAAGRIHVQYTTGLAVLYFDKDVYNYTIVKLQGPELKRYDESEQRLSLYSIAYDPGSKMYLFINANQDRIGNLTLDRQVRLHSTYRVWLDHQSTSSPNALLQLSKTNFRFLNRLHAMEADLKAGYIFIMVRFGPIYRTTFPPNKARKLQAQGPMCLHRGDKRLYYSMGYNPGVFSVNYDGEDSRDHLVKDIAWFVVTDLYIFACVEGHNLVRYNHSEDMERTVPLKYHSSCQKLFWSRGHLISSLHTQGSKLLRIVLSPHEAPLLMKLPRITSIFVLPIDII